MRMGPRALAAAAMLLSACAPAGSARAVHGGASGAPGAPVADSLRFEAVQALQHVRSEPFLAEDDVRDVARGIGVIRGGFPAVRDVRNRWEEAVVQVRLADSLAAPLAARFPARDTLVRETGIAGMDSLNRALGAAGTRIRWEDGPVLEPRFGRPVNAPALATRYGRLAGVRSALPPQFIAGDPWTGGRGARGSRGRAAIPSPDGRGETGSGRAWCPPRSIRRPLRCPCG